MDQLISLIRRAANMVTLKTSEWERTLLSPRTNQYENAKYSMK